MKIIFTDIDGVLNPNFTKKWNKDCVNVYNRICDDYNLLPVITSTWRIRYNIPQLQEIFIKQGIIPKIYDYTPYLSDFRGVEIDDWLIKNSWSKYVVIDDKVDDIKPYVSNVIHCKGWIGLTTKHYEEIKKVLSYGGKGR
jgi:hypothetical protein